MRFIAFAVLLCISIAPSITSAQTDCENSTCALQGPPYPPPLITDTLNGSDYILTVAETVTTLGTSFFQFIDNTGYPNQIRDLLDATLTPSLTYLAGIDDSIFQPFYEEIFDLIDEFILQFSRISNQTQQVDEIVDLLFRATDLAINITRVVFDNNTEVESILSIVEEVLNTTGLQDNVTCILTQFLANENVQALFSNVALENLTLSMSIARPILEVFSQYYLFDSKFSELRSAIPTSYEASLCFDAVLANLVCPMQSRYCQSICGQTLEYCTAVLSQSLQDLSDVLDSVVILTVGYINTYQFEMEFYQIRQTVLSVVESSLESFNESDVISLVNQTIRVCNFLPIVVDILNFVVPPNETVTVDALEQLIYFYLNETLSNFTTDVAPVVYYLENALQVGNIRNLTDNLYYLPNGFLLDGILSLGISNLLRFNPPFGCGEQIGYNPDPFSFPEYYPFYYDCYNGTDMTNSGNGSFPPYYNYYSCGSIGGQCYFSYYDLLYNNQAAQRTCSFTYENFLNADINTITNLCSVLTTLNPESTEILRTAIQSYDKLPFCRNFIVEPAVDCVSNNCTINGPSFLPVVIDDTISGSDYILSVTQTVTTIGSSVWDFIDETPNLNQITDLLNATLTPSLTYLAGVNDTLLRPFYPEIFGIIDEFIYYISQDISDPAQQAYYLVDLLFRAADLAINITREVVYNDTQTDQILYIVEAILNIPNLQSNITCVVEEVFSDPSIQELFGNLTLLYDLTPNMSIVRPILQVFSQSYLFESKFSELLYLIPNSEVTTLCVDAVLANLVCPYESRYCDSLCGETLEYCTAILSQSLQDLSDVLDSVVILTAGYINSEQFEMEFYQIRQAVLYVVENSLTTVSNFDFVEFVNQTLLECNILPLVIDVLNLVQVFPPNATITEQFLEQLILSSVEELQSNLTIDIPSVLYTIENAIQIDNLRNLTSGIYYTPDGFLLDSILSLGISNLLRYRPPYGCGELSTYQEPFIFPQFEPFFFNCFDGTLASTGGNNSYYYYYYSSCGASNSQCSFSYYDLLNNNLAAQRTCSFTQDNFYNATIYTTTNLCTIFGSLPSDSIVILLESVRNYNKLSFCRDFIIEPAVDCVSNNCTINGPSFLPVVIDDTISGADYILNVTQTVTTIGSSVWDFIDETPSPNQITDLLNATLTPSLTYLAGVNDTLLRPFYPEIFGIIDEFIYYISQDISDPAQQAYYLVDLLFRAADLAINITREVVYNDTQTDQILYIVEAILNIPNLQSNITCVVEEVFSDPSIQELFGNLTLLYDLTPNMSIVRPILQVFSQSYLFESKFSELLYLIPNSEVTTLCVDAVLANLVCPYESRYCDSLCGETLEYCTAILSQSLQDLSDVLDSVVILTAGYINSEQFEMEFYQLRQTVLYVIENSLTTVSNFDIVGFVNQTLLECNILPLVIDVLNLVQVFPPNATITEQFLEQLILSSVEGLQSNLTIDIPSLLYTIENAIQIDNLRNLTSGIYYTPDGFLLDSILSLGISNLLRYRPPYGCGEPSYYQEPLTFQQFNPFFYDCFDGTLTSNGGNNNYYYYSSSCGAYNSQCSFSYYDLLDNRAAQRTCSFTQENFYNATINTSTNLCTIFGSLPSDSIDILLESVRNYNKLSFCRDFIVEPPLTCVSNNCTINGPSFLPVVIDDTISGADYILSVTQTVTTIGSSVWDFIDETPNPNQISDLLNATLTPSLTYLAGVNDTLLRPFYPEIFGIIDEFFYYISQDISDPAQQAYYLVDLLFRAADLAINITREVVYNDTQTDQILYIVEAILNIPNLQSNITCVVEEVFSDPSIQELFGNLTLLYDLTPNMSIVRPILQVFSQSYLFESKFSELLYLIPNSEMTTLCVDAVLANLVCPYESRYCDSLCGETLEYCTAILSQSLQDLSDVLDSVVILTAGYINSEQFEMEFYQIRQTVLYVIENALTTVSNFDIVGFVNQTILDCNILPLLINVLNQVQAFPPNVTITEQLLKQVIFMSVQELQSNFTIDIPSVIYTIQNAIQIDNLRNLTSGIYYTPDGFLLDGILSLGISNLLRFRPPLGCGEPSYYQEPLTFQQFNPFFYDCFDGTLDTTGGSSSYYSYYYYSSCGAYSTQCSFSYYDLLYNNRAAQRTCSFTQENFENAAINTTTNLCTIFGSLPSDSIVILLESVRNYNKLSFCRDFIIEPPLTCVSNNCTINGPSFLPVVIDDTISGSDYILSVTQAVTTIGSSVWEFIDETPSPNQISNLLNATLTPSLTYLAGVNDTLLRPFYPEIFGIIDEFIYYISQDISDPAQQASDLVDLLFRAADLAISITREVTNDTQIDQILYFVESILNIPYLQSNITCVVEEVFSDPSIQELFGNLTLLYDLTPNMSIVRPILQVFSQSYLFESKFSELLYLIPNSEMTTLCVDAVLANLVCPYESRYCDSLCGETLEYCTAILSQSLQDLSDVLDSVVILTAGYINSDQFEMEFYQIRQAVLYVVENSLTTVSNFDIVGFVNQTILECNILPLLINVLNQVQAFPPNVTITEQLLKQLIFMSVQELQSNLTIDIPSVLYTIQNAIQIDNLRNLTSGIYYTPDGFLLDGILSLGISNLLRFRPPYGCGELSYYQTPLILQQFNPFFYDCFDGTLDTTGGSSSYYSYYYYSSCGAYSTQCSFSYYDLLYNNRAAQRTCSFTQENFENAAINTTTNLCTIFGSLPSDSIVILLESVRNYNKLSFCRDFIIEPPLTCVSNNCTINGPSFLPVVIDDTISGADYILSVTQTVTTIGSSVWEFIDETPSPNQISNLLNATLTPSLTYLAGVNDTLLRPFYPEIFGIIDEFIYYISQDISDPAQQANNLVDLLFRAADLAISITREVTNDTQIDQILYFVESILNIPYLQSNITCLVEDLFSDPSIQELFGNLTLLHDLTPNMGIVRPILQVFSQSYLFESKFSELLYLIPNSEMTTLCVDAVLANLVCPYESRYCDSLCGETLEYCTAILSQSLQDLSDVLDSVVILTAGYVNSEQFEMEFYQIRQTVLYVVENSLTTVSNFDIVGFVNQTILDCNILPLLINVLNQVQAFPPNVTITEQLLKQLIFMSVQELQSNFTIDIPSVLYTIQNAIQIDNLRNLTSGIYYTPDGFLLDGILSLGISNLLRFRPPYGCGELSYYQEPLTFQQFNPFFYDCFDGTLDITGGSSSYYSYYYYSSCGAYSTQCSFSYYDLLDNRAAQRTCSFTQENFENATIPTSTNLCTIFTSLYPESLTILSYAVQNYSKLSFCRDFIAQPGDCVSNECTMSTEIGQEILPDVVRGSDYVLSVTQTFTTLGTSVWTFIDDIDDPNEIGELLNATLTPALTYLAGVNDTILQPFYPEIFDLIDELVLFLQRNFNDAPQQNAEDLYDLAERSLMLAFDVTFTILDNNTDAENIYQLINNLITLPGFRENTTCAVARLFANEDFGQIEGNLRRLEDMIYMLSGIRPILQVFSQISLFENKFAELFYLIPASEGVSLCIDAVLTNLFCPMESRYCNAHCADTLVYCTALLSQSLQDLSDVLDSLVFLGVAYIQSDDFEIEFNQFRSELLFVVNDTLQVVSEFDIIGFINGTFQECNLVPLLLTIFQSFNVFPPETTPEYFEQYIFNFLNESLSNFMIDIPPILYVIEATVQLDYIRNITLSAGLLPNGFVLDGILTVGVLNTLRLDPPYGCGESAGIQSPLLFEQFYGFYTDCFDGDSVVSTDFTYPSFQFSYDSLLSNMAATRTCSFSYESFMNSTINTTTNLCTVFLYLYPDTRELLQLIVTNYPRLPFCREFILANVTPTTPTTTPPTPMPIDPPTVSFPQQVVTSMVGQFFEYPCTVVGVNSNVTLSSSNSTFLQQDFLQSPNGGQFDIEFTPITTGKFEFTCSAINEAGSDSISLILNVITIDEIIDIINEIPLDEPLPVSTAQELISILTSAVTSNISADSDDAMMLFELADLALDSLTDDRILSSGEAEGLLILFDDIGVTPTAGDVTEAPPPNVVAAPLAVPLGLQRQTLALEQIGLNIVSDLPTDAPPRLLQSDNSILSLLAVTATGSDPINVGFGQSSGSVNIRNSFPDGARVAVASSMIKSSLQVDTTSADFQPSSDLELASALINLNILVNGVQQTDFSDNPPALEFDLPVNPELLFDCQFIDEETSLFVSGVGTDISGEDVVCFPAHLTSFGVLVRSRDITTNAAETLALSIISYLLLSISFIFLIISIIFFLISFKKFFKVETNILYFNYAFSLLLATGVFIFGVQTAKDSPAGCSIVTFLMHYFWLSVFSWSFAISIFMVYILFFGVVQRRRTWWLMMILGWGIPLPIVVITAAIGLSRGVDGYVSIGDHCFISYMYGLIWGFFVPFILLLVATTIAAVFAVIKIFLSVRGKGEQVDELEAMKKTALTVVVLLPVLSAPWILGIINVFITSVVSTTIIEWVTILLTAPTGLLFFLLVVLRNAQVQEVVFRRKPTFPTNASQTSSTTASKFTMPHKARQDETLEREEPTAITNPAYEASSKDTEVKTAPPENEYQTVEPPESPKKKYSQIEKHDD